MDKVESVDVDQSILGRMLNYRRHHNSRNGRRHRAAAQYRCAARISKSGHGALKLAATGERQWQESVMHRRSTRPRSSVSRATPPTGGITRGPMAALHKFNPVRLAYIRDQAAARFNRDSKKLDCLKGLRMLDIGCGGGILSEPLARLGADIVGADPSEDNIKVARAHAEDARRVSRLSCNDGGRPGCRERALRYCAGDGSGRTRRRCRGICSDLHNAWSEPAWFDDRRHA